MATLPQLKALAKRNKIRCKCLNKTEIIALLIDRNIITTSDIFEQKIAENKEPIARQSKCENKKYDYLKGIRNIEVFDPQTDETSIYEIPSIRRDARSIFIPCILMTELF